MTIFKSITTPERKCTYLKKLLTRINEVLE